jgi:MoaA/NifB/PqqE/SkfB family radical SAM enzyme
MYHGGFVERGGVEVSTDRQPLMEIWNADTMRELRRAMVEGRRVAGCEMCYTAEARGGESIRQFDNRNWERGRSDEPKATINEMVALAVDTDFCLPKLPELIDVHISSLCNLKCRMCNSENSSKIAKDAVQRAWEPKEYYPRENPTVKWLRSLENLVHELANETGSEVRRLSFAGGEPLLLRETPRLLERLIAAGRAQFLFLQFISNGSVVPRWLSLAPKFRRLDLVISVDGYAEQYDYIRYPGRWSKLAHHFQLFKNIPNVYPYATTTVQVNNVLHLTDLFRYLDSIDFSFTGYLLQGPGHLAVSILPASIRRVAAARLLEYAETDCRPPQHALVRSLAAQIEAGEDAGNPYLLRDFMLFTNDLDASRGQSIHRSDPELVELLEQAGHPWLHETLHAPAANAAEETRRWRCALTEARNATAKLQQELDATCQILPDGSARVRELLDRSEPQTVHIRAELARVRREIAEVHASMSWRLTRPLRAARRMLPR